MMAAAATTENDVENPTPTSPEEDGNDKLQQQQENEGDGTPPAPQKLTTEERTEYDNNALLHHNPVTRGEKRNINSYYGHKIGFLQTLSLTLNAGLMIYAHRKLLYYIIFATIIIVATYLYLLFTPHILFVAFLTYLLHSFALLFNTQLVYQLSFLAVAILQ